MFGSTRATFPRTLRRGSKGEDVRQLQDLLRRAGNDPGRSDGDYGPATEMAVRDFQRQHGLAADGIVGPLTIAALTSAVVAAPGGGPASRPNGLSLHIGLNNVDPAAYPFPVPVLAGCVNDANDMRDLALNMGFRSKQLLDSAATSTAVKSAIETAAQTLLPGDLLVITYSGHGSQIPDTMGEESDQLDETWVLWDRQLLDDELYDLWCRFQAGVRILLISDSCHSGTVSREIDVATAAVAAAYSGTQRGLTNGRSAAAPRWKSLSALEAMDVALMLDDIVRPSVRDAAGSGRGTDDASRAAIRRAVGSLVTAPSTSSRGLPGATPRRLAPALALQDVRPVRTSTATPRSPLSVVGCRCPRCC